MTGKGGKKKIEGEEAATVRLGEHMAKPHTQPPYNVWAKQPNIKALVNKQYQLACPNGGQVNCNILRNI